MKTKSDDTYKYLLLLLSHTGLHLLLVKELTAVLELEWEFFLENLSVLFDFLGVSILKGAKSLSILLLGLEEILIPLLVELLILLDVSLFALFLLLCLVEDKLLTLLLVILMLQLLQSFLSHLGLNVFALGFAIVSMLIENRPLFYNIIRDKGITYMYSWMFSAFGC